MDFTKLSTAELRDLRTRINNEIELRAYGTVKTLRPGMSIKVDHHKVMGLTGRLVKINRTKCKVDFGIKGVFNVPKTMIEIV
jgi:hypothetical protein